MPVTIYDIAKRAGVSIATVSRVLNGSNRVSDRTKSNVLEVASALGYQPHVSARSLARRKSSIVSAVIPMLTNYFFVEILRGLQDRMAESEYDLLVFACRTMEEVDVQLERALQRGQSAGILVFSSPMSPERADRLRASRQNVVLVDCFHEGLDAVTTDNVFGGELATQHLIACGCRRIAMIMANPESVPARDRHTGYVKAMQEAGLPVEPHLVATSKEVLHHGYTEQEGYVAMQSLLKDECYPDGVFATSDIQAIGALRAIREASLEVPRDIRVVGFDDILISRHVGLSTVRQPMYEMGVMAADRLIARIETREQPRGQTELSPRLVVRRTTESPENIRAEVAG